MKRTRIALIVVALVLVGVLVFANFRNREPRYQGRTLGEWVMDGQNASDKFLDVPGNHHDQLEKDPAWQTAAHAVREIGTNAIPWLLKWAAATDSASKEKLFLWSTRHPSLPLRIKPALQSRVEAATGFKLLGDLSRPAWPALIQWTYAKDPVRRLLGLHFLINTGADRNILKPVLTRLLIDPDPVIQESAAECFDQRYPQEAEAAGVYKLFPKWKPEQRSDTTTNQPIAK